MIDYDKLKLAHELAEKICKQHPYRMIYIGVAFPENEQQFTLDIYEEGIKIIDCDYFCSLWELIIKLKELTQPKPKYKDGDEIWVKQGERQNLVKIKITSAIQCNVKQTWGYNGLYDNGSRAWANEEAAYPTKEALIEAQIEYWQNQYNQMKCRHGLVEAECSLCSTVFKEEIRFKLGQCVVSCECDGSLFPETQIKQDEVDSHSCQLAFSANTEDTLQHRGKCGQGFLGECEHDFIPFPGALALDSCNKCGKSFYPQECQHESDGKDYCPGLFERMISGAEIRGIDTTKFNKCKKCGEFYRGNYAA